MTNLSFARRDDAAQIEAEARDWLLRTGEPGAEAACAAWRAADPRHDAAYRQAQLVWVAIGRTAQAKDGAWRNVPPPRSMAMPAAIAASLAAVVVAGALTLAPGGERIETSKAQTRTVQLDDGSRVFLGARSAVNVRMDATSRRVVLKDGEAFFEVAHDPGRPFTVVAGAAVIRVTGTKFDVRRSPYGVQVSVLEGRVEVRRKPLLPMEPKGPADEVLTRGEQVRLDRQAGLAPATMAAVEPGAWRHGRLLYADAPLKEIVADANRYSRTPIRLGSGDIGDLKVTVSFRPDSVADLIANLDQALPVRVEQRADGGVVIEADPLG